MCLFFKCLSARRRRGFPISTNCCACMNFATKLDLTTSRPRRSSAANRYDTTACSIRKRIESDLMLIMWLHESLQTRPTIENSSLKSMGSLLQGGLENKRENYIIMSYLKVSGKDWKCRIYRMYYKYSSGTKFFITFVIWIETTPSRHMKRSVMLISKSGT